MGQITIKTSNMHKPAPKWWRKLEDGLLIILIPAAVAIISGFDGLDKAFANKIMLFVNVGLVALIKFVGKMLANGEEYTTVDSINSKNLNNGNEKENNEAGKN